MVNRRRAQGGGNRSAIAGAGPSCDSRWKLVSIRFPSGRIIQNRTEQNGMVAMNSSEKWSWYGRSDLVRVISLTPALVPVELSEAITSLEQVLADHDIALTEDTQQALAELKSSPQSVPHDEWQEFEQPFDTGVRLSLRLMPLRGQWQASYQFDWVPLVEALS